MKDLRVSRRRVLKDAAGTGAVAAVMGAGPRVVFAKIRDNSAHSLLGPSRSTSDRR
jgi:hypothetical protein